MTKDKAAPGVDSAAIEQESADCAGSSVIVEPATFYEVVKSASEGEIVEDGVVGSVVNAYVEKREFDQSIREVSQKRVVIDEYVEELARVFKKNHALIVHTSALGAVHKKIYNLCLTRAQQNLLNSSMHFIRFTEMMAWLGWQDGGANRALLMDRLRDLRRSSFAIKYLSELENPDKDGASKLRDISVISSVVEDDHGVGFSFTLDPIVLTLMRDDKLIALINSMEQMNLERSSTITLHELGLLFLEKGRTYTKSVAEWRAILGVDSPGYEDFKEFKRSILTPGMETISQHCSFVMELHVIKAGKKISAFYFTIIKKADVLDTSIIEGELVKEEHEMGLAVAKLKKIGLSKRDEAKALKNGAKWINDFYDYLQDCLLRGVIKENFRGYASSLVNSGATFESEMEKEVLETRAALENEKSLFASNAQKDKEDREAIILRIKKKAGELEAKMAKESLSGISEETLIEALQNLVSKVRVGPVSKRGKELLGEYNKLEGENYHKRHGIIRAIISDASISIVLAKGLGIDNSKTIRSSLVKLFGAPSVRLYERF